ncbi:MAG TPA: hypothetical protein VFL38_02835, partial [Humibacillus xanthopallidus]|nr:hypothetical protein [Humibacillus xanthopallidus]
MADDRGPDGNEGEQRPEDETGNEVGSGAGDGASTGTGDSTGESTGDDSGEDSGDDSGRGSGEDVTRRDPLDSPFGLPLRGGSRDSGPDPFAGLSGLGGPAGFGGFGAGGPGGLGGGDLGAMLEQVLGEAANNPELAEVMRSMGVDPTDPATQAAMRAQLGTFMQAQQTPTGSRDL